MKYWCVRHNQACDYANSGGDCKMSACQTVIGGDRKMTKPEQIEQLTEVIREVQMKNFRQSRSTYTSPEQIAEALYEVGYRMIDTEELVLRFVRYLKNGTYCDNCFRDGKWHRYLFLEDINDITKEFLESET